MSKTALGEQPAVRPESFLFQFWRETPPASARPTEFDFAGDLRRTGDAHLKHEPHVLDAPASNLD